MATAPIRYNNPGAMWPGPSSEKFGARGHGVIGGGNQIAYFDDPVNGAAAQFDLLTRKYTGIPLSAAIQRWSGGNSVGSYLANIQQATGLAPDTVLTPEMMRDPRVAIPLAKAMAQHEAGGAFPLSDEQWGRALTMANGGATPTPAAGAPAQAQPNVESVAAQIYPSASPPASAAPQSPIANAIAGLAPEQKAKGGSDQNPSLASLDLKLPELPQSLRRPVDLSRLQEVLASRARLGTA